MIEENKKDLETLELIKTKKTEEIFVHRCTRLGMTRREIEICGMVWEGYIYKEIADALYISVRTVNKHMQNIFKKAESKNKFSC